MCELETVLREPLYLNFITQKCPTTHNKGYRKKVTGWFSVFYKHSQRKTLKWLSDRRVNFVVYLQCPRKQNNMYFCLFLIFSHVGRTAKLRPVNRINTLFSILHATSLMKIFFSWWDEEVNFRAKNTDLVYIWEERLGTTFSRASVLQEWSRPATLSLPGILSETLSGTQNSVWKSSAKVYDRSPW